MKRWKKIALLAIGAGATCVAVVWYDLGHLSD